MRLCTLLTFFLATQPAALSTTRHQIYHPVPLKEG